MNREEQRAAWRAKYRRNREKVRAYQRSYYRRTHPQNCKPKQTAEEKAARRREWYIKNRPRIIAKALLYWQRNQGKLRSGALAYYYRKMASNPGQMRAKWRARNKKRYAEDTEYRIKVNLRGRVRHALNGIGKAARTEALVGCDWKSLVRHIERLWLSGMTWNNHGIRKGEWSLDHIKPCAAFDLRDPIQQKVCFHYSNLRPLWASENQSKGSRWEGIRRWRKSKHQDADKIL